jgi:hypothetical protein
MAVGAGAMSFGSQHSHCPVISTQPDIESRATHAVNVPRKAECFLNGVEERIDEVVMIGAS